MTPRNSDPTGRGWLATAIAPQTGTLRGTRSVRLALGITAFVLALVAAARIAVPLPGTPVPMTLQVPVVLLAGAVLGPAAGFSAVAAYVALGITGVPVFAAGGGFAYLLGPTGGYLVAMPLAAWVVGSIARPGAGMLWVLVALVLGIASVHLSGLAWMVVVTGLPAAEAAVLTFTPFAVSDVIEIAIVTTALRLFRPSLFLRRREP